MTVVTQAISEKKLQKQPLVTADVEASGHPDALDSQQQSAASNGNNPRPTALLVRVNRSRAKNLQNLTTTCVLLGAVFVFCAGLLASFYWYQEYARYRRNYKGFCGIPYIEKMSPDEMERMVDMQPLFSQMKQDFAPATDTLYEEFDIDLEYGEYEKIDIPDFSKGRKGRYVHDFTRNKTAIVDLEEGRCFIMDLNRSQVLPPKDFLDRINKIESGYYEVNTEVIREQYSVVLPAVNRNDRSSLGYYISESCLDFPIYRLEKINRRNSIVKRSTRVAKRENTFVEFAGRNIAEIEIPNIASAPGVASEKKHLTEHQ